MRKLILNVQSANESIMTKLEKIGAISRLIPPEDVINIEEGRFEARRIYSTDPKYGGHMLLFVNINDTKSDLNYHPDNEEVFLFNPFKIKPLIFLFSLSNYVEIEKKINNKTLNNNDFMALNIPFNNPKLSYFTVNKYFLHYEVTIAGPERSPSFWVTEPKDLPMNIIDMQDYNINLNF